MEGKRKYKSTKNQAAAKKAARIDDGSNFGSVLRSVLEQPIPKKSTHPIMAAARPNPEKLKLIAEEKASKEAAKLVVAKHKWFEKEHVVPDAADANYEKTLLKLATKGIVKLFNAVQSQQQQRMEEKGNSVVAPKPDKLTKGQFLDMLKGGGADEAGPSEKGLTKQKPSKAVVCATSQALSWERDIHRAFIFGFVSGFDGVCNQFSFA